MKVTMPKKRFRKIYVEITNECNLSCSFCSVSEREKQYMSVTNFELILQKTHQFTDYIYLHVKGEPLLHPNLSDILDLCAQYRLKTVLVTNGTLLNRASDILISKSAIKQINISLHCYSELPKNLSKEHYLQTVFGFIRLAHRETDIVISLRFWNQANDSRETHLSNTELFKAIETEFNLDFSIAETLKPAVGLKINDKLWLNSDFEFQWANLSLPPSGTKGTCLGLRDQIAILSDGTVVPCCIDSKGVINLQNIFERDLQEIINSPRATAIINGFRNFQKVEPLCQRCRFFDL